MVPARGIIFHIRPVKQRIRCIYNAASLRTTTTFFIDHSLLLLFNNYASSWPTSHQDWNWHVDVTLLFYRELSHVKSKLETVERSCLACAVVNTMTTVFSAIPIPGMIFALHAKQYCL